MGKLLGWKCDRGDCTTQVESANGAPNDWYVVTIKGGALYYCSDYCNAICAVERYETLSGKTFSRARKTDTTKRPSTEAQRESARRAGITNWHKNHVTPNALCYKCEKEQEPKQGMLMSDASA